MVIPVPPGGVGFFLRFQAAGQLFGLHPGHAGIRPLAGNQRLDGNALFAEHALVLGAQVPVRLILVQIKGLPGNFEPGSGKVTQAVPEQVIVIGLEVDSEPSGIKARYCSSWRGWVRRCLLLPAFLLHGLQKLM